MDFDPLVIARRRRFWMPGMPLREEDPDSFVYTCPMCSRVERQREPMEPMCTGPSWTNDHEPTMMVPAEHRTDANVMLG